MAWESFASLIDESCHLSLDLIFVDFLVSLTVPGNNFVRVYRCPYRRRPIDYVYVRPRVEPVEQVGMTTNDPPEYEALAHMTVGTTTNDPPK
jgi:hypothetical protein